MTLSLISSPLRDPKFTMSNQDGRDASGYVPDFNQYPSVHPDDPWTTFDYNTMGAQFAPSIYIPNDPSFGQYISEPLTHAPEAYMYPPAPSIPERNPQSTYMVPWQTSSAPMVPSNHATSEPANSQQNPKRPPGTRIPLLFLEECLGTVHQAWESASQITSRFKMTSGHTTKPPCSIPEESQDKLSRFQHILKRYTCGYQNATQSGNRANTNVVLEKPDYEELGTLISKLKKETDTMSKADTSCGSVTCKFYYTKFHKSVIDVEKSLTEAKEKGIPKESDDSETKIRSLGGLGLAETFLHGTGQFSG